MQLKEAALTLWAKSGEPPHPLLAHMLDAAAVALAILKREPGRTRKLYARDWGLPEEEALRFVAFLVGLHDLGKASPVFQAAWPEGAEQVKEAGFSWDEERVGQKEFWVAHGVFTEVLSYEFLKAKGLPRRMARRLSWALGAHHGFPAQEAEKKKAGLHLCLETPLWHEARAFLVERLWEAVEVRAPQAREAPPEAVLRVMALTSFADWIASDPNFFPYGRHPLDTSYWEEALSLAHKALNRIGWTSREPLPEKPFQALFPFPPNVLQETTADLLQEAQTPVLLLVEAPMGLGKTEAALYAYHLLQGKVGHRGLYVALPTQATANGFFLRVKEFLEKFKDGILLDLQLQHGAAVLNPQYEALLEKARPTQVYEADSLPEKYFQEAEKAAVVASSWFSAKKRAMLSPHGVGTLDQALLGVLKVKHHFIRLWGLMNRVVILDEVHAYDTYTSGLLKALLRWLRALGSSVVLMTATLPRRKREELLSAWGATREALPPYPRVAAFGKGLLGAKSLSLTLQKSVHLESAPIDVSVLSDTLREKLPGVVGAIVNTVDRAQALYRALGEGERLTLAEILDLLGKGLDKGPWPELRKAREEKGHYVVGKRLQDGTLIFLLHARFPAEERALREGIALALFGKHGPRPQKAVLVATQVAEQSLDLDFDLLYTDLAPMDLLFQRAGRLWRHERARPENHPEPVLMVGGIDQGPEFGRDLHWNRVYEDYVLLSTWLSLQERKALAVPQGLEVLLEEVYERTPDVFPVELRKRAEESFAALMERWAQEAKIAENLALSDLEMLFSQTDTAALAAEFRLDDEAEDERTQRFLTRLGDPSVPVVPLYRIGEGWFMDPQGKCRIKLKGDLTKEEALALWGRAVRLSRTPIPQILLKEEPPPAWRKSGLLRNLRPLEVGRDFGRIRVDLDPELGITYFTG